MSVYFKSILLSFITLILFSCECNVQNKNLVQTNFIFADKQLTTMCGMLGSTDLIPRSYEDEKLKLVNSSDWTSGFFPGNLWYMYEYTRDVKWKDLAEIYSTGLEKEKSNGTTHDIGFKLMCSFGNGYRLTNNPEYKKILLEGANTLLTRFNPITGCIRSWDHNKNKWDYPVIIDNMMNLELLYWAFNQTRDSSFYYAASSHAEMTMINHYRDDYSSFHVVSYDTLTGEAVAKNTHQGYSDESAWARGQAWGLYGFTMVYRETGNEKFLKQAQGIADFILSDNNFPADGIPYWDYNAPDLPNAYKDASAAAITASALYELSLYVSNMDKEKYFAAADLILSTLSSIEYLTDKQEDGGFILQHSVGNFPTGGEIDKPIIYADYYFLEANLRRLKITGDWEGKKADIIIKADDLTFNKESVVNERWQKFADLVVNYNIKAAAGIVGSSLEMGNKDFFDWINKYKETGLFEFWNHGQLHKRWEINEERVSEFFNQNKEKQMAYLKQTQDLATEKLGFPFITFGAPYNWTDENTALALEEFPEIKVWLYPQKDPKSNKKLVPRQLMLNIEYPVHNVNFYHFLNNYYFYSKEDVFAIQGHPHSWDEHGFDQFTLFAKYFNETGIKTILPEELVADF